MVQVHQFGVGASFCYLSTVKYHDFIGVLYCTESMCNRYHCPSTNSVLQSLLNEVFAFRV